MIQRSQRGKQPQTSELRPVKLNLHERIASQRLWFLRLMTASTVALALSFVLWLLRVPLEYHLVGIALGFITGLFVRRPMQAWALAWIRERAGLSYETALEQRTRADDFGFSETLQQRASEETSRLAPPKYQVWWLPMLAVALGLAFLPLIPSVANIPSPFNAPPQTAPTTTTVNEPNPSEPNQPSAAEAANEPNATDASASPSSATGETNASELNNPGGSSSSSASQNNQSADEEALGRFLDNLKENEPESASPDADLSSVMPQGQRNSTSDEDNASRPRSEQTNPFAQPGDQQEEGQAQADSSQNAEGEEGQGNEGEQNQEGQSQGSQEQQQAQGENGGGEEQASSGEEQGEGTSPQSTGEEGEQNQGGNGESASADGAGDQGENDTGQNAEGAGNLPGSPLGQSEEAIGSSQQNPEFLQGRVNEGPNNTAGTVRLPGETSQTVFPEGSSPGSFSRAEEEALTEGRIPLEYQEVIRNYFRSGQ
jgi:hypothetical protein